MVNQPQNANIRRFSSRQIKLFRHVLVVSIVDRALTHIQKFRMYHAAGLTKYKNAVSYKFRDLYMLI